MESCNRMRKGKAVDYLDTCVDRFDEDLPLLPKIYLFPHEALLCSLGPILSEYFLSFL